jgi:hypothetical protein
MQTASYKGTALAYRPAKNFPEQSDDSANIMV